MCKSKGAGDGWEQSCEYTTPFFPSQIGEIEHKSDWKGSAIEKDQLYARSCPQKLPMHEVVHLAKVKIWEVILFVELVLMVLVSLQYPNAIFWETKKQKQNMFLLLYIITQDIVKTLLDKS